MRQKFNLFLITLFLLISTTISFSQISEFCETEVYHFMNPAEIPSKILLTITNIDNHTMLVGIESADSDPVDFLLVLDGNGATVSDEQYPFPGVITRTLSWAIAPDSVSLNVLWSKISFGGNWQLTLNDIIVPFAANCPAQTGSYLVNFEEGGIGSEWEWVVEQNGDNPPIEFINNPMPDTTNPSEKVGKFIARVDGQPWALAFTDDIEPFKFDAENSHIKIMIHKPTISNVGLKFEGPEGDKEIQIANTLINQWELMDFDFSEVVGNTYNRIVILPDFEARTEERIIYFDNILLPEGNVQQEPEPTVAAPNPEYPEENVISLFSNEYNNVLVDTWSAEWDQANVEDIQIEGNDTKKYTNLVFAGIEFASQPINASNMTHFHMDFWTPDPTALPAVFKIKLVDFGSDGLFGGGDDSEAIVTLDETTIPAITSQQWVSLNIPMDAFSGLASREHLAQMIIEGNPNTIYIDNVLFHESDPSLLIYNVDFEDGGLGSDWEWIVEQNGDNPPIEFIDNPMPDAVNGSEKVAKFIARLDGMPWALTFTDSIQPFKFNAENSLIKIMVHKPVVSNVALKFEGPDGAKEIQLANTSVNQWEEMEFNFSEVIGNTYNRFVFIPDFEARTEERLIYFDNIVLPQQNIQSQPEPSVAAPSPILPEENVISLFSNAYNNVLVDTWSAVWDQANLEDIQIEGNDTKKYTNLVFAGIEFTSQPIDASEMTNFHFDFWTPDPTSLPAVFKIKLVDFGPDGLFGGGDDTESIVTLDANSVPPLASEQWVGFDIPLDAFSGLASREHLAQMILEGNPNTVYIDNVYFFNESSNISLQFEVTSNWNLLSFPVLADNMSVETLFPNAVSDAFQFYNGYLPVDELITGEGYWLKFDNQETINATGQSATANIGLEQGWNIIGPFDTNIDISTIQTNPSGIITSAFFSFNNGYVTSDFLEPGKGYWVKASEQGEILIGILNKNGNKTETVSSDWSSLTITDAKGRTKVLYLSENEVNGFELPPVPPIGAFDVRFSTNRYAECISTSLDINLNSLTYPVKISIEGTDIRLTDKTNSINNILKTGNHLTITDASVNSLTLSAIEIPVDFSLTQNYPNPFNPSTTINFALPIDSKVVLSVYNILGEKITELVNGQLEAGNHTINFNASSLSSGMYIYKIEAGSFSQVRKMILMK